jgi:hypothetical protein
MVVCCDITTLFTIVFTACMHALQRPALAYGHDVVIAVIVVTRKGIALAFFVDNTGQVHDVNP